MMQMRVTAAVAAVLLTVGLQNARASTTVAVVNVPLVSERYQKTADLEAQCETIRHGLNDQREALRDRIERTSRSLQEELKPGTPEFRARRKELAMLEAELQWFVESEGKKIEGDLAASLLLIFADIQAVVREVAAEKGIDVVLSADQMADANPETPMQVRQQIVLQKVLYWSPRVDLTSEVIERLNAKYGAEKARSQ